MKSFKKLRDFALQGHKNRDKNGSNQGQNQTYGGAGGYVQPTADLELVTKGMKDVKGMQKNYEGLVSLSSEVSNRAYDLSTAVEEMASYFAATFGVLDDQDIGKIFKLVGEVQFEISKSLELYASHVTQTVTEPTVNLINELLNVMETKKQYDEKRLSLDHLRLRTSRGKSKNVKGDAQDEDQLDTIREQFEEVSGFLGGRIISLQQGRPRSLITQAARHHAAQMQLFSKGLTSLHGLEPHIKQITQELNIDRRLSSADRDEFEDGDDEAMSDTEVLDDDGSYFDDGYEDKDHQHVREDDLGSESSENGGIAQLNMSREWSSQMASGSDRRSPVNEGFESPLPRWTIKGSKSAPTSPLATSDGVDDVDRSPPRHVSAVPPPTRSPPVPSDRGHSGISQQHSDMRLHESNPSTSERSPVRTSPRHHNFMPVSSPRQQGRTTKMGVPLSMYSQPEPSQTTWPMPLPPSSEPPPMLNFEAPLSSNPRGFVRIHSTTPSKKIYSYSGPLTSSTKPLCKPTISDVPNSGPLRPYPSTIGKVGPLKSPRGQTFSPKISPTISPPKMSPPRISELHKLPPPPLSASSSSLIAHSAPLHRETNTLNASPLPPPPLANVSRSLSMTGITGKPQKQQRYKGVSIAEVEEEATTSSQPKSAPQSGNSGTHHNISKQQPGNQSPMLQRSASGSGGSSAPRNGGHQSTISERTQSGSADKKSWRLNTMLHSSPSLTSAYSVESPPTVSPADGKERCQPGNDFELGRRSLDAALPCSKYSNWSRWKSFSSHDKDDLSIIAQLGMQSRDSSQTHVHNISSRDGTMNGVRHV